MKITQTIPYLWFATLIALWGFVSWQQFPMLASYSNSKLSYRDLARAQLQLMLNPLVLITWAILVTTAIVWSWKRRNIWREQRGIFYVFAACSFSVVWFLVLLIVLR
jgi:hypothetical protein